MAFVAAWLALGSASLAWSFGHQPAALAKRAAPPTLMSMSVDLKTTFPAERLPPTKVVELQCLALQQEDFQVYWRFCSHEDKGGTGLLRAGRRPYLHHPDYAQMPLFKPLVCCQDFEIVGALQISNSRYECRVRVWPAGGERECAGNAIPYAPVLYIWQVALQPLIRPTCFEYDPLQQGISAGPPYAGCWLGDGIRRDDRWRGGDDGDATPIVPVGGGGERVPLDSRALERAFQLSPSCEQRGCKCSVGGSIGAVIGT